MSWATCCGLKKLDQKQLDDNNNRQRIHDKLKYCVKTWTNNKTTLVAIGIPKSFHGISLKLASMQRYLRTNRFLTLILYHLDSCLSGMKIATSDSQSLSLSSTRSFLPFGFHCFGLIFPAIIVGREVLSLKQNMGFQKSGHTRFLVRVGLL